MMVLIVGIVVTQVATLTAAVLAGEYIALLVVPALWIATFWALRQD